MILIIKSNHSLSTLLTDRSSGWWATQWVTVQSISILTHSLSEWSEHSSHTVMTMNTIDSKERHSWWNTLLIVQINSLNHYSQHSDLTSPSLTIPFVSLIHPILSLVMKNRLLFVSIHRNFCPTNSLHWSEWDWGWMWSWTIRVTIQHSFASSAVVDDNQIWSLPSEFESHCQVSVYSTVISH